VRACYTWIWTSTMAMAFRTRLWPIRTCYPHVLTISFHQSGETLFPGTGDVLELGFGAGHGAVANVPLAAGTDDVSWIAALDALVPPLAERFRPDLLVSQHGCDTHAWDPLADLQLTTHGLVHGAHLLHTLAHRWCGGRWLATGGGGYDVYRVVPRSWALLWAEMTGRHLPRRIPPEWRTRWASKTPHPLPTRFEDTVDPGGAEAAGAAGAAGTAGTAALDDVVRIASVSATNAAKRNRETVAQVQRLLLLAS
jgi:hypothetical protein